jgi:hypothetical protein
MAIMRVEELDQLNNSMALSGFDPATFRLVAEHLNQLRYRSVYASTSLKESPCYVIQNRPLKVMYHVHFHKVQ